MRRYNIIIGEPPSHVKGLINEDSPGTHHWIDSARLPSML
jgi:hypothetical protein